MLPADAIALRSVDRADIAPAVPIVPAREPNPAPESWEIHVELARSGDPGARATLVDLFGPRVLAYLQRFTRHYHDAEDLTQDTLVKAFQMLPSLRQPRTFPAWLFTIARRVALNHHRDTRVHEPLETDCCNPDPSPSHVAAARDDWDHLWTLARQHLTAAQLEALWLRHAEDMSIKEIARITGRTSIHVRVLLHRGRQSLVAVATRLQLHPSAIP